MFIEEIVPNTWLDLKAITNIDITNKKILDVGCATGFFSDRFAEKAERVIGFDISEVNIRIANKLKKKENVDFIVMDAANINHFNNDSFDIIFAANILEHLENLEAFLRDAKKILKPGGLFIAIIGTKPKLIHPITSYITDTVDKAYPDNHPQVHQTKYLSTKDMSCDLDIVSQKKYDGIIGIFIAYSLMVTERVIRRLTGFKPDNIGDHYNNVDTNYMKFYIKTILPILRYFAEKDFLKMITNKELIIYRRPK